MGDTFGVRILEDGAASPLVVLSLTSAGTGHDSWGGLLLEAHVQPPGSMLTLRVERPRHLAGATAKVRCGPGGVAGQPVVGCTPLTAPTAVTARLPELDRDPSSRVNGDHGSREAAHRR